MGASKNSRYPGWMMALAVVLLLGALGWSDYLQMRRIAYVSGLGGERPPADDTSPTGYAGGTRWMITVPQASDHYEWLADTEKMLAQHGWRVRHTDFANAPDGYEVRRSSLTRWWLGLLAWCDHALKGGLPGLAVEAALLVASPILHALLIAAGTVLSWRRWGGWSAGVLALGLMSAPPLRAIFSPGSLDERGVALAAALASALALISGLARPGTTTADNNATAGRGAFVLSGALLGVCLWVNVACAAVVVLGTGVGAVLARLVGMTKNDQGAAARPPPNPWRLWAYSGALVSLGGYMLEYFPGHMDLSLETNHPVYALALIAFAEFLGLTETRPRPASLMAATRTAGVLLGGIVVAGLFGMALSGHAYQPTRAVDPLLAKVAELTRSVFAKSASDWLRAGNNGLEFAAALLPALAGLFGAIPALRRAAAGGRSGALAVSVGWLLLGLVMAATGQQWLALLSGFGWLLLALLFAEPEGARAPTPRAGALISGLLALLLLPGLLHLVRTARLHARPELTHAEAEALMLRETAHWLRLRLGSAPGVILAPPAITSGLGYYGGFRGVGTFSEGNPHGLIAAIRLIGERAPDVALETVQRRGITHIVLPSWDQSLDELARLMVSKAETVLITALRGWSQPSWLRPVAFNPPQIEGFADSSVMIFEVVPEQDQVLALCRMADYFIEMEQYGHARAAVAALAKFPTDMNGLIASAQLEIASGSRTVSPATLALILTNLEAGYDRILPRDRRVALAVILAQSRRLDLAGEQIARCMLGLDEAHLRELSPAALYRFLALAKACGVRFPDAGLAETGRRLLPAAARKRFE